MARQRRGGFRPPELRGTLGTLLRTTLAQAGAVREVLERGAREGRSRLGEAMSNRRRSDALAELGEIVLELIRRGEIDVEEIPEARDLVAHLDELDAGHSDQHDNEVGPPPVRSRFDQRDRDEDDGTVGSRTWEPPNRAKTPMRVWRPSVPTAAAPPAPVAEPHEPPRDKHRKGGISFDDDDLADYMHPDDVPPKSKDGDS